MRVMTRMSPSLAAIGLVVLVCAGSGTSRAQNAPAAAGAQAPAVPQVTLEPGLRPVPDYRKLVADVPAPAIPDGFTSIFNGRDLTGWRASATARHGVTPDFHVAHGMILGTQRPLGGGGLLLTERRYRNFELHMEVKPDWGNDSGILFRTTPEGVAYQITLDYLPGGSMGRMIGEGGIQGTVNATTVAGAAVAPAPPAGGSTTDPGMAAWKREDWNTVRLRVQGEVPRATVWINGQLITDAVDAANHAVGGMIDGPIALQIHGGTPRWQPGGFWRWRNIAIRELD
jgi:hypothetical protein